MEDFASLIVPVASASLLIKFVIEVGKMTNLIKSENAAKASIALNGLLSVAYMIVANMGQGEAFDRFIIYANGIMPGLAGMLLLATLMGGTGVVMTKGWHEILKWVGIPSVTK